MIWQLGNWLNVEGIVIRFAKKKKKKKNCIGDTFKKSSQGWHWKFWPQETEGWSCTNYNGEDLEGRSSVLNNLSLRWWLHTYINMESRQLDIKFYNSEDKSKMEMTIGNLSLCGCLNPWENRPKHLSWFSKLSWRTLIN